MTETQSCVKGEAPELEAICRLCLQPDAGVLCIFDSGQLSIPVRIMACAALEVQPSDGLPKLICQKCRYQLEVSYYFRKKCQLSDTKLRKHVRLLNAGKQSRVFVKSMEDDEDEEEIEFEDSINFIRAEDEKVQKLEQEKRALWLAEQQEKFRKEETQRLFEEFGNFMNSRKPAEKIAPCDNEEPRFEIKKVETIGSGPAPPLRKKAQVPTDKVPRVKITKRRPEPIVEKPENEITSSEQVEVDDQILIYDDEHGDHATGSVQTFFLYEKDTGEVGPSQIIEIESAVTNVVEDETNPDDNEEELVESCNMNEDTSAPDDDDEFVFASEFDEAENRDDDDAMDMESPNSEQSYDGMYQIEENGEIRYLNDQKGTGMLSISDDDEDVQIMLSKNQSELDPEFQAVRPKMLRKATKAPGSEQPEQKTVSTTQFEAVDVSKVCTDDLRIFKCNDCPQSFTRMKSLTRHRAAHKKGREYSCEMCSKYFSCKSSLDRHIRIHTGEKPFKCEICGKRYMQKEVLKRHETIHTGERPHRCPHCPRAFVQKLMLTQHIKAIHLEVPEITKYTCHLCPKSFLHASGLSRHLLTHSGMKFRCSACGRSFNDKSSIRRHVQSMHSKSTEKTMITATKISAKDEVVESPQEFVI